MNQDNSSNQKPGKSNPLNDLLNKEMDRKQFLKYSGSAMLGVAGLSGVAKVLTKQPQRQQSGNSQSLSYGGGAYGGRKAS